MANVNGVPIQALYYFYQAAEHGSFKKAAEALFVTPGAMSQQIRLLEERLDVALFVRGHRKVELTEAGRQLLPFVREAFGKLREGLNQIGNDPNPQALTLSTLSSFGQQWLVPRLGRLKQQMPELTLSMLPTDSLIDFNRDSVDLCIRYGRGNYPGLHSELLMADTLYPVCHPLYLQQNPIKNLKDLCGCHLIEDKVPDMSWQQWLKQAGVAEGGYAASIQYEGSHFVLEGALSLQGVALVRHSLAWRYVEQGTLVRLFDVQVPSPNQYWLCAPPSYFRREKVQRVTAWLHQQAQSFVASSSMAGAESR